MLPALARNHDAICRHYLLLTKADSCEAGVAYNDLAARLKVRRAGVVGVCMGRCPGCDLYQPYSAEEIRVNDLRVQAEAASETLVRNAIMRKTLGKRGTWGNMPCPICTGTLAYSVSEFGARITARCSMPQCVNWNDPT